MGDIFKFRGKNKLLLRIVLILLFNLFIVGKLFEIEIDEFGACFRRLQA